MTLFGIVICVKLVQQQNAKSVITCTEVGIKALEPKLFPKYYHSREPQFEIKAEQYFTSKCVGINQGNRSRYRKG